MLDPHHHLWCICWLIGLQSASPLACKLTRSRNSVHCCIPSAEIRALSTVGDPSHPDPQLFLKRLNSNHYTLCQFPHALSTLAGHASSSMKVQPTVGFRLRRQPPGAPPAPGQPGTACPLRAALLPHFLHQPMCSVHGGCGS